MHILFVADGDFKYGASKSMLQMITELLKIDDSLEISVVIPFSSVQEEAYKKLKCNVYYIPYEPFYHGVPYQKWKLLPKYVLKGIGYGFGRLCAENILRKKIDISSVDIIHSNSSRDDFGELLAEKYKKPLVWHIREYGDLDYKCFSFRKDYILLMNQMATQIIAVSDTVAEHWVKKGVCRDKVMRVYNGVENIFMAQDDKKIQNEEKVRFIILGSINETKGQYQLIEAIELLSEKEKHMLTVDIVGDGVRAYVKKLQKHVKEKHLDTTIYFRGYCKDFHLNLGQYDCGVMCSRAEGFGRVTVEYMMAGLPVIASDTGANSEIIVKEKNGLLYRYGDTNELKEKIIYILKNRVKIKEMGEYARSYAVSEFSSKVNAENIYKIYKKILAI